MAEEGMEADQGESESGESQKSRRDAGLGRADLV
jgi:hypothetical protein